MKRRKTYRDGLREAKSAILRKVRTLKHNGFSDYFVIEKWIVDWKPVK